MAFVVRRKDGRFEIRESISTPRGPRCRSLATFHKLSESVLDHAEARAVTAFDREAIRERAHARGVPFDSSPGTRAARRLLEDLVHDRPLPDTLIQAIRRELDRRAPRELADTVTPALDWLGSTPTERGRALRDLLRVSDRIPARPRPDATPYPRIHSALV